MSYYRLCVKLHTMRKITHRAWNNTLCTKEHRGPFCVQNGQIPGKLLHLTDQYQWCPQIGNGPTFYLGSWVFMLFGICPKCAQSVLWVFICSTKMSVLGYVPFPTPQEGGLATNPWGQYRWSGISYIGELWYMPSPPSVGCLQNKKHPKIALLESFPN